MNEKKISLFCYNVPVLAVLYMLNRPVFIANWCPALSRPRMLRRRLEVVGAKKNGRARGKHARGEGIFPSLVSLSRTGFSPTTSKHLLRRLTSTLYSKSRTPFYPSRLHVTCAAGASQHLPATIQTSVNSRNFADSSYLLPNSNFFDFFITGSSYRESV